jgi:hypothetical protein
MAKYTSVLGDEIHQNPRPRSRMGGLILLALALAVAPLLYEGGLIVFGKWQTMTGTYIEVRTPLLDRLTEAWNSAQTELRYRAPSLMRFGGLPPLGIVVAVAALALCASLFLRRG